MFVDGPFDVVGEIDDLTDRRRQLREKRRQRDQTEERLEAVTAEIDECAELEDRREAARDEVEDLRTSVDRLEQEAVRQFNDHMASVLETLDYDNLERVWSERTGERVREGRRTVTKSRFDLTVVRSTDPGSVYEDTVEHPSESEREVTGLVFALAGYLVHDGVPFVLVYSVGAIDAPRLADLVDYFRDHAGYVVTALLEQDARALDHEYRRISEI